MNFEEGKVYNGFILKWVRDVVEINSKALYLEHEKSGARLLKFLNDDDNKVFNIIFRTPPLNSSGLPHILEHSVLCGSRKFPVKEPFVNLLKGSLNTFLNAMTFSDKTMYPVASKNDKDFFNLMDVYLDAVFYPKLHEVPEILMQEGWHYELLNETDELSIKGVVYNEMKGAYSSPESLLFSEIQKSLFPDTPYRFDSGGNPDNIPSLTQEEFRDFHKKYYHPSNSYIFLYGNGDFLKELQFIDENYLKDFSKEEIDSSISIQKPFECILEETLSYPIGKEEDAKDKTYLSLNFVTGDSTDKYDYLGLQLLEQILLETPASPLKRALIDAGIGKDVFGQLDYSLRQLPLSIISKNSNYDKSEEFKDVVFKTLKKIVNEGLDPKLVEATVNIMEFKMREADFSGYPKGLIYIIKLMDSWLHDGDPLLHIAFNETIDYIKENSKKGYFENLIKKYLLDNKHASLIVLKPENGLEEKREEELKVKLKKIKEVLSKEEIDGIIKRAKKLQLRQETPDKPEDVRKIPILKLSDIKKEVEKIPQEEILFKGTKVLYHKMFTNNIAYINLLFNTGGVKGKDLPYLGLMTDILRKLGTKKYSYMELSNEININTGGIGFSVEIFSEKGNPEAFKTYLAIRSRALIEKLPELMNLTKEIVFNTSFDDKKRILELVREIKSKYEMKVFDRGDQVAGRRLLSFISPGGKYYELTAGLDYYKFIDNLERNFDGLFNEVKEGLLRVRDNVFLKGNLISAVTIQDKDVQSFEEHFGSFVDGLKDREILKEKIDFDLKPKKEALLTPAKVQYAAKGYNFVKLNKAYNGSMLVLKNILGTEYLWNKVRVQGGAYGCSSYFDMGGNLYFVSYRDPNLATTLKTYDEVEEYLNNFEADEREITGYIIGTVSDLDYPLTPVMKGDRALSLYLRGVNYDDLQRERDEVLKTTKEDIRKLSSVVGEAMDKGIYCVLGSEEKLKENKSLFDSMIKVFE